MKLSMSTRLVKRVLMMIITCVFINHTYALRDEHSASLHLSDIAPKQSPPTTIYLNYTDGTYNTDEVNNPSKYGINRQFKLSLNYLRDLKTDMQSGRDWSIVVSYEITFSKESAGGDIVETGDLVIKHGYGGYIYSASKMFTKASIYYKAKVRITGITETTWQPGPPANVPYSDIEIKISNITEKYTAFNYFLQPTISSTLNNKLSWTDMISSGAEEYDLEYVYYDLHNIPGSVPSNEVLFENAIRVTVPASTPYYPLSYSYPDGKLFCRVRAVGVFIQNVNGNYTYKLPGVWSGLFSIEIVNNNTSSSTLNSCEPLLNWQYTEELAEEGKYKKVFTYMDGSLRKRQNIANMSLGNDISLPPENYFTVIADNKYDYEGRDVVSILPVPDYSIPAANQGFGLYNYSYRRNFNTKSSTAIFDKTVFDNTAITLPNRKLDPGSGAGKYFTDPASYVPNSSAFPWISYTPNAGGYPYSQVEYMEDQTGRVKRSSGIGPDHQLGSKNETKYYYGNTNQTELVRLFGTDVGVSSHYKKNLVMDPNGQVSVSYLDQEDRVIATALAGLTPDNVNALSNNVATSITVNLNANNHYNNDNEWKSVTDHLNEVPNTIYSFSYTLGYTNDQLGSIFSGCTECIFKLKIYITDPKGNIQQFTVGSNPALVNDYTVTYKNGNPDGSCTSSGTPISNTINFSATFPDIGNYTIVKILTLDEETDLELLKTQIKLRSDAPNLTTITNSMLAGIDYSGCNYTIYQQCYEKLKAEQGGEPSEEDIQICIKQKQEEMIDGSEECESILSQIQRQVAAPEGVFYLNDYFLESKRPSGVTLTATQIRNQWETISWPDPDNSSVNISAEAYYTKMHREYCQYQKCVRLEDSREFDIKMGMMKTWNEALNGCYINPLNYPGNCSGPTQIDPYFTGWGAADFQAMKDFLDDPFPGSGQNIWSYLDPSNNPGFYTSIGIDPSDPNSDEVQQKHWSMFYALYSGKKGDLVKNFMGCTYFDDDNTIVKSPTPVIDADPTTIGDKMNDEMDNQCAMLCEKKVSMWLQQIQDKVAAICPTTTISAGDLSAIEDNLKSYCETTCGPQNPLALLTNENIAAGNDNLTAIANLLSTRYSSCSFVLADIAVSDPYEYTELSESQKICSYPRMVSFFASLNDFIHNYNDPAVDPANPQLSEEMGYSIPDPCSSANLSASFFDADTSGAIDMRFFAGAHFQCFTFHIIADGSTERLIDVREIINIQFDGSTLQYTVVYADGTTHTFTIIEFAKYSPCPICILDQNCKEITKVVSGFIPEFDNSYNIDWTAEQVKCKEELEARARLRAQEEWQRQMDEFVFNHLQMHFAACRASAQENFSMTYLLREYQYTLYYYDQAGNLVQTVPPEGVDIITDVLKLKNYEDVIMKVAALSYPEPQHCLLSIYRYNSLNQVVWQQTPDGGITRFGYNRKGQLILSQNAQQNTVINTDNPFITKYVCSYTRYDDLGRITEVGQINDLELDITLSDFDAYFQKKLAVPNTDFPDATVYTLTQMTLTEYDNPINAADVVITQENLRSRVSYSYTMPDESTKQNFTAYSYDAHGNVKELVQRIGALPQKSIKYSYDLVSNKVNYVFYQKDQVDQFTHRYGYDLDNRLKYAQTTRTNQYYTTDTRFTMENDASYFYNFHGPLARVELGTDHVQGLDYYYTIHGWLKGMNITNLSPSTDPGSDGASGKPNALFGYDEVAFTLGYYSGDYIPVAAVNMGAANATTSWNSSNLGSKILSRNGRPGLMNGNIAYMISDISEISTRFPTGSNPLTGLMGRAFQYDQLNRIIQAGAFSYDAAATTWNRVTPSGSTNIGAQAYDETFTYDYNGNLRHIKRNDQGGVALDEWDYDYTRYTSGVNSGKLVSNQLKSLVLGGAANYSYDKIGNLIKDIAAGINTIEWTVYGKIAKIDFTDPDKMDLEFTYDATGNRVAKISKPNSSFGSSAWRYTYYVRDAVGNVMATYYNEQTFDVKAVTNPDLTNTSFTQIDQSLITSTGASGAQTFGNFISQTFATNTAFVNGVKAQMVSVDKLQFLLHTTPVAYAHALNLQVYLFNGYNPTKFINAFVLANGGNNTYLKDLLTYDNDPSRRTLLTYLINTYTQAFWTQLYTLNPSIYISKIHNVFLPGQPFTSITESAPLVQQYYVTHNAIAVAQVYSWFTYDQITLAIKNLASPGALAVTLINYNNMFSPNLKIITQVIYSIDFIIAQLSIYDIVEATTVILNAVPTVCDQIAATLPTLYLQICGQYYADKIGAALTAGSFVTKQQYLDLIRSYYGDVAYAAFITQLCNDMHSTAPCDSYSEHHNDYYLGEWYIYGSSRLGIKKARLLTTNTTFRITNGLAVVLTSQNIPVDQTAYSNYRTYTQYEITNHLGNVLATVSDHKLGIGTAGALTADHYEADVITAQNYYAFGSLMPKQAYVKPDNNVTKFSITRMLTTGESLVLQVGANSFTLTQYNASYTTISQYVNAIATYLKSWSPNSSVNVTNNTITVYPGLTGPGYNWQAGNYFTLINDGYRFGFNGKERDNESYGDGNEYDYGFRIYNPKLGKFLSVDPIAQEYPWYTPYQFAGNKPIEAIDIDGLEEYFVFEYTLRNSFGLEFVYKVDYIKVIETSVVNKKRGMVAVLIHTGFNSSRRRSAEEMKGYNKDQAQQAQDNGRMVDYNGARIDALRKNEPSNRNPGRAFFIVTTGATYDPDEGINKKQVEEKFNKSEMLPQLVALDNIATALVNDPTLTVRVDGYASDLPTNLKGWLPTLSNANNLMLAELRAVAAKEFLLDYIKKKFGIQNFEQCRIGTAIGGVYPAGSDPEKQQGVKYVPIPGTN